MPLQKTLFDILGQSNMRTANGQLAFAFLGAAAFTNPCP
jgi:hypothetical protein